MTCLRDLTPNMPFDPTVSLPRLRLGRMSAGQRQRSPHRWRMERKGNALLDAQQDGGASRVARRTVRVHRFLSARHPRRSLPGRRAAALEGISRRSPVRGRPDARWSAAGPRPGGLARARLCRGPERHVRVTLCGGQDGPAPQPGGGARAGQGGRYRVAQGGAAAVAAKQATSTIPIVIAPASGDAVATGLITSLARPGGNVTGMTDEVVQLSAKRVEMLKEALPKAGLIAVIWNANDEGMTLRYRGIEQAARAFRLEVQALGVREPDDFAVAFSTMTRRRPDAIFLVADAVTGMHRKRVIEFAATQRIPAMYEFSLLVRDGGLTSIWNSPRGTTSQSISRRRRRWD